MLSYVLGACLALIPAASSEKSPDSWITMKARLKLAGVGDIKSGKVHVDTDQGIVTLYGKVPSDKAKVEAQKAVGSLDGVKRVDNLLQVVPEALEKQVSENDK